MVCSALSFQRLFYKAISLTIVSWGLPKETILSLLFYLFFQFGLSCLCVVTPLCPFSLGLICHRLWFITVTNIYTQWNLKLLRHSSMLHWGSKSTSFGNPFLNITTYEFRIKLALFTSFGGWVPTALNFPPLKTQHTEQISTTIPCTGKFYIIGRHSLQQWLVWGSEMYFATQNWP